MRLGLPFRFLQDLIAKIPTPKFTLPVWTGCFRYVVLAAFVLLIPYFWVKATRCFSAACVPPARWKGPCRTSPEAGDRRQPDIWPSATKITILVVILVATFFTWRPWCTLFCPLGAIYAIFNHVSFFFLRFHPDRCIGCADCRSLCLDGGKAKRRIDGLRASAAWIAPAAEQ